MKAKLVIECKCPKCGKKTTYNLLNVKELRKNDKLEKIYICSYCGNKIIK